MVPIHILEMNGIDDAIQRPRQPFIRLWERSGLASGLGLQALWCYQCVDWPSRNDNIDAFSALFLRISIFV